MGSKPLFKSIRGESSLKPRPTVGLISCRVVSGELNKSAPRLGAAFADISNLNNQGQIWDRGSRQRMYKEGNKLWHTDSSFKFKPGLCSLLYATQVTPIGGYTEFADQRAAYDALTPEMKTKCRA